MQFLRYEKLCRQMQSPLNETRAEQSMKAVPSGRFVCEIILQPRVTSKIPVKKAFASSLADGVIIESMLCTNGVLKIMSVKRKNRHMKAPTFKIPITEE